MNLPKLQKEAATLIVVSVSLLFTLKCTTTGIKETYVPGSRAGLGLSQSIGIEGVNIGMSIDEANGRLSQIGCSVIKDDPNSIVGRFDIGGDGFENNNVLRAETLCDKSAVFSRFRLRLFRGMVYAVQISLRNDSREAMQEANRKLRLKYAEEFYVDGVRFTADVGGENLVRRDDYGSDTRYGFLRRYDTGAVTVRATYPRSLYLVLTDKQVAADQESREQRAQQEAKQRADEEKARKLKKDTDFGL